MQYILFLIINFQTIFSTVLAQDNNFNTIISQYETKYVYKGEKSSRAHNIELAISKINNIVLQPQEIFSYNNTVGRRTFSNGFRKAPVINEGILEDGIGGGICQVSGTLHATVFYAGLNIIESTQHSRTSTYIQPGLDSTVDFGSKDFKFQNNFSFPVKISINNFRDDKRGHIIIQLLGARKPYNVQHETIIHYKSKISVEKRTLENMPASYRKVVEVGTPAMDITRIRRISNINDNTLVIEESKRIWYNASKRVIEYGTKQQ